MNTPAGSTTNHNSGRTVVTVTFELAGRRSDFAIDTHRWSVEIGDFVVVESRRKPSLGRVVRGPHVPARGGGRLRKVIRAAREDDIAKQREAEARVPELFRSALQVFRGKNLPLKLVAAVPDALADRVTFYVVAPERMESDELEAELSNAVGSRAEVKQLGLRDETKALGGLGRCGQELCCSTFLPSYPAVSIRQAKDQGMALAQDRTAGVCGKTLCCLAYEADLYKERRPFLPKLGKRARTLEGVEGKVIGVDVMRGTFTLFDLHRKTRTVLPAEQWEKNKGREVPAPEFPRTLAASKSGGLRDRIGDPAALPAAPPTGHATERPSSGGGSKRPNTRRRGRNTGPQAPREES